MKVLIQSQAHIKLADVSCSLVVTDLNVDSRLDLVVGVNDVRALAF